MKKQDEIESHKLLLEHKEEVLEEYEKFKKENSELFELMEKIFGE